MVTNFTSAMVKILDFLQLDQGVGREMKKWLTKANARVRQVKSVEMLPETKRLLDDVYGPYNKLLATLLEDKRYEWPGE